MTTQIQAALKALDRLAKSRYNTVADVMADEATIRTALQSQAGLVEALEACLPSLQENDRSWRVLDGAEQALAAHNKGVKL